MSSKTDLNKKFISFLEQTKDDTHKSVTHLNDRVLIVDGLNTFIRSFAVNPAVNEDGLHIGGMIGFLRSIRYTCDILNHLVVLSYLMVKVVQRKDRNYIQNIKLIVKLRKD